MLLAGANAAAEDVPKKRIALEKSFMVVCIVHKAQFVRGNEQAELELLKSDVMVTLQIMGKSEQK